MFFKQVVTLLALSAALGVESPPSSAALAQAHSSASIDALGVRLIALEVGYDPILAYFIGVPAPDHRRWADRSPQAIAAYHAQSDRLLADLRRIDPETLPSVSQNIHASLLERLEAEKVRRVCQSEWWAVNHMNGWHLALPPVAQEQPVGTAQERLQALERWASLPSAIDQEIANARMGLAANYSSPKPVVRKVIRQIEGLMAGAPEDSPLYSPAERSKDADFRKRFREMLVGPIRAALARYRGFLQDEYLPRARDALGIIANPNGAACYQASLRFNTTLDRPAEEVFRLGKQTVEANKARVIELGRAKFGTGNLGEIVQRIGTAADNRFKSEEELIAFSRAAVAHAKKNSARLFKALPRQEMLVGPFPAFRRGTGGSSYYEADADPAKPAFFRINSETWKEETRGGAEITALHEGYPGHHMQIATANLLHTPPVAKLTGNSAYTEGWARYAEMLAEEAGMYRTDYALMTRRLWPARGMVVDVGLHLLGWTREQVVDFMQESGRFTRADDDDTVDRMAVWPGQLAAYDSGGLEIYALRQEAAAALGDRFDLREFHQRVLKSGAVPLVKLRANVQAWIAAEKKRR